MYANHGCMPEETRIGAWFEVDVELETDFSQAAQNDELEHTIDYVQVREIVEREMAIPSKLIEHVGQRIKIAMAEEINQAHQSKVVVRKYNAPMGGEVSWVSIEV